MVWFGSFVKWHIYFRRLFNAKAILVKDIYYLTYCWGKGDGDTSSSWCLKMKVIVRLVLELAYCEFITLATTLRVFPRCGSIVKFSS